MRLKALGGVGPFMGALEEEARGGVVKDFVSLCSCGSV